MTHQEIEQELKFYEDNENLQQVQKRLNNEYKHIRGLIALEYIEIILNIEDEDQKSKLIEMLQRWWYI